MIRTKFPIQYEKLGDKTSIIEIEITNRKIVDDKSIFTIVDYFFDNGIRVIDDERVREYPNSYVDQIEAYIEANFDLSALTATEKEKKKWQIALMMDTQTNLYPSGVTVRRLQPNDWEFSY